MEDRRLRMPSDAIATEEQSAASEEINRNVTEVNTLSGENARAMDSAVKAIEELTREVTALGGIIDTLRHS